MAKLDETFHLTSIVESLDRRMGVKNTPDHPRLEKGRIIIFGIPVPWDQVQFVDEFNKVSAWRSVPSGRRRLRVAGVPKRARRFSVSEYSGPIPETRSFVPKPDGTYDYGAIAERLYDWMVVYRSWWRAQKAKRDNAGLITRLRDELGCLPAGVMLEEGGSIEAPVRVRVSVDRSMTEEQARTFVAKLRRVL